MARRGVVAELWPRGIHITIQAVRQEHDQILARPLPHDELVRLQRCAQEVRAAWLTWLDKEMAWHAPHEGRSGRPPVFSNSAIQFCLSIKVSFKLPLRPTAGMIASPLRLAGLDQRVPDYIWPQ